MFFTHSIYSETCVLFLEKLLSFLPSHLGLSGFPSVTLTEKLLCILPYIIISLIQLKAEVEYRIRSLKKPSNRYNHKNMWKKTKLKSQQCDFSIIMICWHVASCLWHSKWTVCFLHMCIHIKSHMDEWPRWERCGGSNVDAVLCPP